MQLDVFKIEMLRLDHSPNKLYNIFYSIKISKLSSDEEEVMQTNLSCNKSYLGGCKIDGKD